MVQFDAVAFDRAVDLRFVPGAVVLGAATRLRAQAVRLVDDERNQLRHPLERRRLVGRQGSQCEKVLQKGAFERQRIFAADLQIEDVELVTGHELQGREDRLAAAPRPERFLDQADKPFRALANVGLADQRQFCALRAEHGGGEAQPDVDRVGEYGFAGARRGDENVHDQRAFAAPGGIVRPDTAVRPPEQHAAALPRRGGAVPRQHQQRVAEQSKGRVGGRGQSQPGGRAHHSFKRVADDSGRLGVAPALDPLRQG